MMKRMLLALVAVFTFASFAGAMDWKADKVHSTVGFEVRHLVISKTKGEFEDFSGNVRLLAKSSILELQSETLKAKVELKNTDPDPSADPYALLGLPKAASWADVRKKYLQLTKRYHPDQYSTVDLPKEVVQYMSGVFSQSNTAYNLIKSTMAKSEAA